ncbi:response regulator [Archangium gephyra]|uniref:response regulator n=1 Tax=Archangium gephyra TaxID=48 RepID=UPI0035D463B8
MPVPSPAVLVVEDETDLREIIQDVLAGEGYRVTCASDGAQALDWLAGGLRPGMVLLDFYMPRLDGWAFLERMRTELNLGEVPVVAISGSDVSHPSVTAVLRKPFDITELLETVQRFTRVP